jgi:ribosomal protein L4
MNNILSVNPGEYVKGAVVADVSNAKAIQTKSGKTIFKATLRDGQNVVDATSFSKTFEHVDGKRVQFSGPGIKRGDDYNGKANVVIGDKVVFKAVGEPTPTETAPQPEEPRKIDSRPIPAPSRVEGVTVGMAINKAVDVLNAQQLAVTELAVWQIASRLIRVATRLQAGELHASEEPTSEEVPF